MNQSKLSIVSGSMFERVYEKDNYLIEYEMEGNGQERVAVIYFSSSGLYFPNTQEAFEEALIKNDRYEFRNSELKIKAQKSIYVRDIAKQFYITGISAALPDMDSLIHFLKEETDGYKILTIGSSAGAYVAALVGSVLNAQLVFCFSGYFDLNILDRNVWFYIEKYENDKRYAKYFSLQEYIKKSNAQIIYFYPGLLEGDVEQSFCVKDLKNVISIKMNSDIHGLCVSRYVVKHLFEMDPNEAYASLRDFVAKHVELISDKDLLKWFFGQKWYWYHLCEFVHRIKKKVRHLLQRFMK